MKTMKFVLALSALAAASSVLPQAVLSRAAPQARIDRNTAVSDLSLQISEADLRSLSIKMSAAVASGSDSALVAKGTGLSAGKASFSDLSIMRAVDKASPMLAKHCAAGTHFPKATLMVRKAGKEQQEYYTIVLENVVVSSYQCSPSSGGDRPMESLSLNFTKIEFDYRPPKDR